MHLKMQSFWMRHMHAVLLQHAEAVAANSATTHTRRPPAFSLSHQGFSVAAVAPAGASPEFSHLLSRLLDKNPATRIKWQVCPAEGSQPQLASNASLLAHDCSHCDG
jgi:hypothetical protein